MNADSELVIAGAGVIGLAIAYEALRAGLGVTVLERGATPGEGAAGVAAGMLAPAAEADTGDEALVTFALESCALYPEFIAAVEKDSGLSCGYRSEGTLVVALNHDHDQELQRLAAFQERFGIRPRWLDGDEALELEPALSPRVTRALANEGDRQVDPRRLLKALAAAVGERGGRIVTGANVTAVNTGGGGVRTVSFRASGRDEEMRTNQVVVAGGAWTQQIVGAPGLPLRPVKGQILRLAGPPLINRVVRTPDVYLVPRSDGELVVGATSEEQGFDCTVTARGVRELLSEACRTLPGSEELELRESAANLRPALRDSLPCIGPSDVGGLFVAAGHYRHGVMLAPATAKYLVELIRTGGGVPSILGPFQAGRFGDRSGSNRPMEAGRV